MHHCCIIHVFINVGTTPVFINYARGNRKSHHLLFLPQAVQHVFKVFQAVQVGFSGMHVWLFPDQACQTMQPLQRRRFAPPMIPSTVEQRLNRFWLLTPQIHAVKLLLHHLSEWSCMCIERAFLNALPGHFGSLV